jgi:hypothetical protein
MELSDVPEKIPSDRGSIPGPSDYYKKLTYPIKKEISLAFEKLTIVKGKAIQLEAWTGPEVSRRLKLPDFKKIGI